MKMNTADAVADGAPAGFAPTLRRIGITAGLAFGFGLLAMFMADEAKASESDSDQEEHASEGLLDDVTRPVTETVTEPVAEEVEAAGESAAEVTEPVAEAVEPVTGTAGEAVEPVAEAVEPVTGTAGEVTEPVAEAVEPVTGTAGEAVEPVAEAVEPVVEATGPVVAPAANAVEPVTEPVLSSTLTLADPVLEATSTTLKPVTEPVLGASEPVVSPVADAVGGEQAVANLGAEPVESSTIAEDKSATIEDEWHGDRPIIADTTTTPADVGNRGGAAPLDDTDPQKPAGPFAPAGNTSATTTVAGPGGSHHSDGAASIESSRLNGESIQDRGPPTTEKVSERWSFDDRSHPS